MLRTILKRSAAVVAVFLCPPVLIAQAPEPRLFTFDDLDRVLRLPYNAALSTDGRWVSYVVGDSLWLAPADGGVHRPVADGMGNQVNFDIPFQRWSSDGSRLLFRTGSGGVYGQGTPVIYDVAAGVLAPLLPDSFTARLQTFRSWTVGPPAWSPDDSRVALTAVDTAADTLSLYVVDVATRATGLRARWEDGATRAFSGITAAAWSPDGRRLAYAAGGLRSDGRIVLVGRAAEPREEVMLLDGAARLYSDLRWSPDGRYLAALRYGTGSPMLIEVGEAGDGRVVAEQVPLTDPFWTADGRLVGERRRGMSVALAVWRPGEAAAMPLTGPDTLFDLVGVARLHGTTRLAYSAENGALPRDVWTAELPAGSNALVAPRQLTRAHAWADSIALARAEVRRWVVPGGDTLEAQLFVPPPAAGAPPYPLVVRPYGGFVNEFPGSDYFLSAGVQLLAARGWAVVRPNTRGMVSETPGRYGTIQLEDTKALVETMVAEGLIDPRRVAVIGHSHGGALAYYDLTHSEDFCGVIAVNGWSDWSQIASRLDVSDEELPARLAQDSPLRNTAAVTAPLLAVAGAHDTQVLPVNAARMVEALHALGKPAELLHFEDEGHLIENAGNRRAFWRRTLGFLERSCGRE